MVPSIFRVYSAIRIFSQMYAYQPSLPAHTPLFRRVAITTQPVLGMYRRSVFRGSTINNGVEMVFSFIVIFMRRWDVPMCGYFFSVGIFANVASNNWMQTTSHITAVTTTTTHVPNQHMLAICSVLLSTLRWHIE